jgi:hypothetical protein
MSMSDVALRMNQSNAFKFFINYMKIFSQNSLILIPIQIVNGFFVFYIATWVIRFVFPSIHLNMAHIDFGNSVFALLYNRKIVKYLLSNVYLKSSEKHPL